MTNDGRPGLPQYADWWKERNDESKKRECLRKFQMLDVNQKRQVLHLMIFLIWLRDWRHQKRGMPDRAVLHGALLVASFWLTRSLGLDG